MVGVVFSPAVVTAGEWFAQSYGVEPLSTPWLLMPLMIVTGIVFVRFVRPDPKEIGTHLERYYADYRFRRCRAAITGPSQVSARALLAQFPTRVAIISHCAAQGNMTIVMVLTSWSSTTTATRSRLSPSRRRSTAAACMACRFPLGGSAIAGAAAWCSSSVW